MKPKKIRYKRLEQADWQGVVNEMRKFSAAGSSGEPLPVTRYPFRIPLQFGTPPQSPDAGTASPVDPDHGFSAIQPDDSATR